MTSNKTDIPQQTIDRLQVTVKQQSTDRYKFHILATNHVTTKLTNPNHNQKHSYHVMVTLHLTLKMTAVQVVEMSPHLVDHSRQRTI